VFRGRSREGTILIGVPGAGGGRMISPPARPVPDTGGPAAPRTPCRLRLVRGWQTSSTGFRPGLPAPIVCGGPGAEPPAGSVGKAVDRCPPIEKRGSVCRCRGACCPPGPPAHCDWRGGWTILFPASPLPSSRSNRVPGSGGATPGQECGAGDWITLAPGNGERFYAAKKREVRVFS